MEWRTRGREDERGRVVSGEPGDCVATTAQQRETQHEPMLSWSCSRWNTPTPEKLQQEKHTTPPRLHVLPGLRFRQSGPLVGQRSAASGSASHAQRRQAPTTEKATRALSDYLRAGWPDGSNTS